MNLELKREDFGVIVGRDVFKARTLCANNTVFGLLKKYVDLGILDLVFGDEYAGLNLVEIGDYKITNDPAIDRKYIEDISVALCRASNLRDTKVETEKKYFSTKDVYIRLADIPCHFKKYTGSKSKAYELNGTTIKTIGRLSFMFRLRDEVSSKMDFSLVEECKEVLKFLYDLETEVKINHDCDYLDAVYNILTNEIGVDFTIESFEKINDMVKAKLVITRAYDLTTGKATEDLEETNISLYATYSDVSDRYFPCWVNTDFYSRHLSHDAKHKCLYLASEIATEVESGEGVDNYDPTNMFTTGKKCVSSGLKINKEVAKGLGLRRSHHSTVLLIADPTPAKFLKEDEELLDPKNYVEPKKKHGRVLNNDHIKSDFINNFKQNGGKKNAKYKLK